MSWTFSVERGARASILSRLARLPFSREVSPVNSNHLDFTSPIIHQPPSTSPNHAPRPCDWSHCTLPRERPTPPSLPTPSRNRQARTGEAELEKPQGVAAHSTTGTAVSSGKPRLDLLITSSSFALTVDTIRRIRSCGTAYKGCLENLT